MTCSPKNRHPSSRRRIRLLPTNRRIHPINGQRPVRLELRTTYFHEVDPSQPSHSAEGTSQSTSSSADEPPASSIATTLDSQQRLTNAELREMRRLAALLPVHLQVQNPQAQPALLVNNVAKYISQLTATVVARVQNNSLPKDVLEQLFIAIPSSPSNGRRISTNSGQKHRPRASRGLIGRPNKKKGRKLDQKK